MRISLLPRAIFSTLPQISPDYLRRQGIRLLMLDFDNTIVPYTTDTPSPEMERWLRNLTQSEIQVCVVSNSRKNRVPAFCSRYDLACITHARKPFGKGIDRCMKQYGLLPSQCALVGDQIYTDVLGANCAGVFAILVSAIDNHTIWLRLRHVLELPVIFFAKGRKIQS